MSLYPMYDRLVNFDPETLEATPGLATSWDQPDPQTLVLQLQDGVTFHDGTPFDAEAVKYNLDRALTLETSTEKADLAMIESVEATGPLEVTIHMNRPDASLLLILADRPGMMVSPTAAEASGADFGRNPVGTGPFKFVEWRHRRPPGRGEEPRLLAGRQAVPRQDHVPLHLRRADGEQRAAHARGGRRPEARRREVETLDVDDLDIEVNPSLGVTLCYFNFSRPPFNDPQVRRAASLAVDREAHQRGASLRARRPASEIFPPGYWAADPELGVVFPFDLDEARELMASAGLADGVSIQGLTYTRHGPDPADGDHAGPARRDRHRHERRAGRRRHGDLDVLQGSRPRPVLRRLERPARSEPDDEQPLRRRLVLQRRQVRQPRDVRGARGGRAPRRTRPPAPRPSPRSSG